MESVLVRNMVPWKDMNVLLFETPIRELQLTDNGRCAGTHSFRKESSIPAPASLQSLDLSDNRINKIYLNLTFVTFLNLMGNALGPFLSENSYMLTGKSRLQHRQKLRFRLYTFRGRIHFLYYKTKFKNRFRSTKHSENNLDYIYDAFVSYSDDDREFVLNDCIEHIENEGNSKLCVHQRDFVPGEDITDNILHAIESSRKTICIITRSFLQSYYCMFEFNMARMESIHSRNGKNILFLVFYEQLLPEELPLVLYEVIQKQTYIEFPNDEYGNRIFWEKIKDGISA
ncbi:Hypothetical predicted protein [Mytilus galloprovincialis]|uniref:TIR domain-containing protein n=1 Tax=Mytilus galloprovincialis TaxID=29158 RepID=A0A8B6GVH6_MYTGA|nr:Hypothetical predicted protein [Mytilus galloprovincialis]